MEALAIREMRDDEREAVAALWESCGLTRPWNDPAADIALALAGPASTLLVGEVAGDAPAGLAASVMVGHDGHRGHALMMLVCCIPMLAVAALHTITTLTGSALLALAVAEGRIDADEAWRAAHADEDWNIEHWGSDAEAEARRAARWKDMKAASDLFSAVTG